MLQTTLQKLYLASVVIENADAKLCCSIYNTELVPNTECMEREIELEE